LLQHLGSLNPPFCVLTLGLLLTSVSTTIVFPLAFFLQ
jgi:hypothetical protein